VFFFEFETFPVYDTEGDSTAGEFVLCIITFITGLSTCSMPVPFLWSSRAFFCSQEFLLMLSSSFNEGS
jgi:hypothetical protein